MHVYFTPLAIGLVLLLFWAYIAWRSVALVRRTDSLLGWRPGATFAALLFVTISTGLAVFMSIHTAFTGGYAFGDPVEMFCLRVGFWCALVALIAGPGGMKKLRLSVSILAFINLLLWFMDAMGQ